MSPAAHTEERFEALIEAHLLAHGYVAAPPGAYDRARAILPTALLSFLQSSQPKAWAKLSAQLGAQLKDKLLDEVCKLMDKRGALAVLRQGFKFYGQELRLACFEPGHQANPALWARYKDNILTVVRQLRYDENNDNELDLVLFVNGVPVVTAELKNKLTGQNVEHAVHQYQRDRDPRAPIFRFKARALVHFAVGSDRVAMTTRLAGEATRFLPFNRGYKRGAGNPPVPGAHRTAYLWEEVWRRDSLLDIIARFIHLQVETGVDKRTGKRWREEAMIFPRYHQLDAVRRLIAAARAKGAGRNYLVQHSAGSGKSNTIAWLAHRLASLHDAADHKVYDSVVVLTDRRVLDQQLQDTIYQFDHKPGVVERISGGVKSSRLAAALKSGAPIIVCTLQSFGFVHEKIQEIPERRYAVIVDEAHSSQSGDMALALRAALAGTGLEERLAAEVEPGEAESTTAARREALTRGPQENMSFFAFTATPKFKTLELFGDRDEAGQPRAFHLYSMRQAIEEGFILNVLHGYTTYERFFRLAKAVAEDPELDKRKAAAALSRFVDLHPTNIAQKIQIIIEHFRETVAHQLGGRAKAMLVTRSRLQAVRYKLAFDQYVADKSYKLSSLVAFSGEVKDELHP